MNLYKLHANPEQLLWHEYEEQFLLKFAIDAVRALEPLEEHQRIRSFALDDFVQTYPVPNAELDAEFLNLVKNSNSPYEWEWTIVEYVEHYRNSIKWPAIEEYLTWWSDNTTAELLHGFGVESSGTTYDNIVGTDRN